MTEPEPFAPCPPDCPIPADIHRHYQRDLGVSDYFVLAEPLPCCGREYARPDEVTFHNLCEWCWQDNKPMPGMVALIPNITPVRDMPRRRRP